MKRFRHCSVTISSMNVQKHHLGVFRRWRSWTVLVVMNGLKRFGAVQNVFWWWRSWAVCDVMGFFGYLILVWNIKNKIWKLIKTLCALQKRVIYAFIFFDMKFNFLKLIKKYSCRTHHSFFLALLVLKYAEKPIFNSNLVF